jgi:hypothetical protein
MILKINLALELLLSFALDFIRQTIIISEYIYNNIFSVLPLAQLLPILSRSSTVIIL